MARLLLTFKNKQFLDFWLKKMTPSQQCKQAGLKSLAELVKITNVSEQTLINWHKNKPKLFSVVIAGAVKIKIDNT